MFRYHLPTAILATLLCTPTALHSQRLFEQDGIELRGTLRESCRRSACCA